MTPEQQRITIAVACGWTSRKDIERFWRAVDAAGIPDFLNDLNAMHEAEKILTKVQRTAYVNILWKKCALEHLDPYEWSVSATAAQRAEAFLRTIGKWEESK